MQIGQPEASRKMHPAYMAGFIDADGCISVNYKHVLTAMSGKKKTPRAARFNVSVIIVQKEEKVVRLFLEENGGTVVICKSGKHLYFRWRVSGRAVIPFLKKIQPYIIEKKEQCDIALESAIHQYECGRGRFQAGCKGTQPLSESDLAFRRAAWLRMKELNTCHKFRAAAETKSNDPEAIQGSDSPSPMVTSGSAAKALCA